MGLFIHLIVNFDDIDDKKWEKTYEESLEMLQQFPIPLVTVKAEKINGKKRCVATEDIVENEGLKDEHWSICGDWDSEQLAENFFLYRYQKARYDNIQKQESKNILWAPKGSIDSFYARGNNIFGNKTQGRPFHLAVLAVGILFENRFPNNIFVTGDISKTQAEGILPWMNSVLKEHLKLPIVTDGERLYKKLNELYDEPNLVIERFKTLYSESKEAESNILFKHANREFVLQSFVKSLCQYTSITQLGAIKIISKFLVATQDVKQLIELILQVGKNRNEFGLEELLRILVKRFITVEKKERELLKLFVDPEERLATIEAVFAQTFMKLGGAPETIDFYIDSAELLKIFASYIPSKEGVLQAIMREGERECQQNIEKIQKILMDRKEMISSEQEREEEQGEEIPTLISEEACIRSEAHAQKATGHLEVLSKKHLRGLADSIKEAIYKLPEVARDNSIQFYRDAIYVASYNHAIILSRSQWDRIDNCKDKTILKALMILASDPNNTLDFNEFRDYLLRNHQTWPQLVGTADKSV